VRWLAFLALLACGPVEQHQHHTDVHQTIVVTDEPDNPSTFGTVLTDGEGHLSLDGQGVSGVEFWHEYLLVKLPKDTPDNYVMLAQASFGHADTVAIGLSSDGYPASFISVRRDAESLVFLDLRRLAIRVQFVVAK
jgi:hypothetical protein